MDAFNLKTASTYINNLLLARGLLRDGKPIEFARPSKAEGGKEAALAQIINLVHDLILKRDVRLLFPIPPPLLCPSPISLAQSTFLAHLCPYIRIDS
jgi:hypothetical protein